MELPEVAVNRTVEFADTDAAGLVHFSNYFRYVEAAERVFFERHGIPLMVEEGTCLRGYPRARASCDYSLPLRFGEAVSVRLRLKSIGSHSLVFNFRIERTASGNDSVELVAKGSITTVHARFDRSTGQIESLPLPDELTKLFAAHGTPEADA